MIWDAKVDELRVRAGPRKTMFTAYREFRDHGKRVVICKNLGRWPDVSVSAAREAALAAFADKRDRGKRKAVKLCEAIDAYVSHLEAASLAKGKRAVWARVVRNLSTQLILPKFGNRSLSELAASPTAVAEWHREISEGRPISGVACARISSGVLPESLQTRSLVVGRRLANVGNRNACLQTLTEGSPIRFLSRMGHRMAQD